MDVTSRTSHARVESLEARPLAPIEVETATAHLAGDAKRNLVLIDLVARLGGPSAPGEAAAEIVGAWRGGAIAGLAAVRPSVVFDAHVAPEALEAFLPFLERLRIGLVKSAAPEVEPVWAYLSRGGARRALVDRFETAYAVNERQIRPIPIRPGCTTRAARREDLESLEFAARESLREEDRPDPFAGDARGFRRWVRGRLASARVIEWGDRIVFVGYADVRRREGWLLQGIYTWPEVRRQGFARIGTRALCHEAFAAGADHVQLAVVDGNHPALALYEALGFQPFTRLRTILFG